MAKKSHKIVPLTLTEIILGGDSETIRKALEARIQIDTLLEEREAAYRRIAELETQVSEIVGEDGIFPFPAPPMPVAIYAQAPAPKKKAAHVIAETIDEADDETPGSAGVPAGISDEANDADEADDTSKDSTEK